MAAFCRQQFTFVFRKMLQQPDGTYEASYEVTCPYTYQTNSASFAPRTMPTTGAGGFTGTIKGDDGKTYNNYASYTTLGSGGGNPIIYNQSNPGLTTFASTPTGYIRDISNPTVYASAVGGTEITQLRPAITWFDDYSAYVDIFFNLQSCEVKLYTIAGEKIDGHWRFEKTSTRKLYSSASVLKGASYSLPTAEVMQEHIGEDYTLLVSSTPGKFWFEGAPDNPANDTMEQAYLTQLVKNPVVVTKSVNLYCMYFLSDDAKLVKFGTLKKMFGTYKQKSDAALDAKLAALPSGGMDTEAVNSAIDAKLETYTTERNTYVTNAIANAGYATDAEVAQAVEEGTSGLATTESVTDAVGSAKTELRGEMPKPYDFVSNPDREDAGYFTAKNLYEDEIVTGMAASDMINLALRRPSATSNNTWGFLGVKKSDIEAVANAAIEAKMAEVREAVNGVLLFEELSAPTADVELPDVAVSAYERFAVTLRCEVTTGSAARRSIQSVDVYAADLNALNTSSFAAVYKPVVFLMNKGLLNKYMVSNVICHFCDNAARTGLYVVGTWAYDANVILDPEGGVTQGDESMGDVLVSVERIVGYKKLPEVS